MAILPMRNTAPRGITPPQQTQPINIEAWTEQATASLATVTIAASPTVRRTSVPLSIPLDEQTIKAGQAIEDDDDAEPQSTTSRRKLLRRDSLDRRNALLKGKEGSRRRQRWENDRLLSNPHAVLPLPSDWEVHPTHPQRSVPYFLAPLWDAEVRTRQAAARTKASSATATQDPKARLPGELRAKLKHAKAAKGLLQDLEEEVRRFVAGWERKQALLRQKGLGDVGADSEDEEIVFVGRGGAMLDVPASPQVKRGKGKDGWERVDRDENIDEEHVKKEKLVFESAAEDRAASFGRWLVHSIATYYDLRTWSVTVGDPARREASTNALPDFEFFVSIIAPDSLPIHDATGIGLTNQTESRTIFAQDKRKHEHRERIHSKSPGFMDRGPRPTVSLAVVKNFRSGTVYASADWKS
ncbi:hypothetical protein MMC19_003734 [Ptychographa xylographoides]|nr:hypothetical protein [Ptychographa xylographoides]